MTDSFVYIELHCASAFSFLRGASLPETLVERAAALGYTTLALLDADGVYGAPRFHKAARQAGLRPIIGAELTIDKSQIPDTKSPITNRQSQIADRKWQLPVLVASQEGIGICRLVDPHEDAARLKVRARS